MSTTVDDVDAPFGQVLTAMVTPFGDDGEVAYDVAADLARWLVAHGNDGLVVAGTTGESPTITRDEQLELFRVVRDAVDVPMIAGAGSNDTRTAIDMHRQATEIGVDAILSVTPYYNRPSQEGLYQHFRAAAEATDLPVMLYDIPIRSGRRIEQATMLRLFEEVPNITAVKDALGRPAETARLLAAGRGEVAVYSGDDAMTLPLLSVGAVGVVGVATHWAAREMGQMIAAFQKGDVELARRLNERLLPSFDFETGDQAPNPIPTKAVMRRLGFPVGQCRPPMGPEPAGLTVAADAILDQLRIGEPSGDEATSGSAE